MQDAIAERKAQRLDRRMPFFARHLVDEILQRFAREHTRRAAVAERRGKVPFEPQRDREVLRIVAIAAPQDAQEAKLRLAVTARMNERHALY